MAKEGPEHRTMAEAFATRLRQLYSEPSVIYSEGKVVKPVGLKPDVYLKHPDDRQWAFEMVHGNSHALHLLDNHRRYAEAGINDVWILWDALRPKSGKVSPMDQGVIGSTLDTIRNFPLTATHRAILEMQSADVRSLYAFTIDPSGAQLAFMRMVAIGLYVYRFEGWTGEKRFNAERTFVSLSELEFQADGRPVLPRKTQEDDQLAEVTQLLGLDAQSGIIPSEIMERMEQAMRSPSDSLAPLVPLLLQRALSNLSPEQMQAVMDAIKSPEFQARLADAPRANFSSEDLAQAFQDPEVMRRMGEETQRASQILKNIDLPAPLWAILEPLLNDREFTQVAELMKWQAESAALGEARSKK